MVRNMIWNEGRTSGSADPVATPGFVPGITVDMEP